MTRERTLTTLKASRKRTVQLEQWTEGGAPRQCVTKRFHDAGLLAFIQDGQRARSEHRLLERLRRAGVSVPQPYGCRRRGREWQVTMEWLPDTTSLERWLDGERPAHLDEGRVARAVGELLATLHRAGLEHTDLHAGNVLLDRSAHAWMIDFHQARLRSRLTPRRMVEDLVATAARGREACSERFRARVLLAWRRGLGEALAQGLPDRSRLVEEVEARARERRRAMVASDRRWNGAGGFLAELRADGRRALHPRSISTIAAAALARQAAEVGPLEEDCTVETSAHGDDGAPLHCVIRRGSPAETRHAWRTAGRLWQHRVPTLAPVALGMEPAGWVALTAGASSGAPEGAEPTERKRRARAVGALLGTLHDRGLTVEDLVDADLHELHLNGPHGPQVPEAARDASAPPRLDPRVRLQELDPRPGLGRRRFAFLPAEAVRRAGPGERSAFLAGYLSAFRGGAEERRALRTELRSAAAQDPAPVGS